MLSVILIVSLVASTQAVPHPKSDEPKILNNLPIENAQDKTTSVISLPHNDDISIKDNQFASSQILENPAYDPSLYQSFIPQDAVQQYVNQFGSPYGSYPSVYQNPGFAVQTGYEGYLVPTIPQPEESTSLTSIGFSLLQGFLSRSIIGWLTRAASYLVSALGVVVFGGALTTAICTFTPVCSITFAALPFLRLKETAKDITKTLGAEITADRVRRTAELVKEAIEKYSEMQKEFGAIEESSVQKIEKEIVEKHE
ncbi:unnamed protein product [Hermetia illucens]|uniref:Uncharacterized protein n=2 Tax=Hermetia illucens TaxID=343691 RepID=A0A7R8UQR7_HERIL|nr:unnamed protein product [Hermetia illucens]